MDICALGARIGLDSLLHTLSHVQRGSSCDDAMVLRFFDASDVHVAVPLPPDAGPSITYAHMSLFLFHTRRDFVLSSKAPHDAQPQVNKLLHAGSKMSLKTKVL